MKTWRKFAMADLEDYDQEWDAYLALANRKEIASGSSLMISSSPLHRRAPAAAVMAPSTMRSTTSPRVLSRAASTDEFSSKPCTTVDDPSPEARRLYDLLIGDTAAPSSTMSLHPSSSGKDGLTPEARRINDYLVGDSVTTAPAASELSIMLRNPMVLKVAPISVDIDDADLAITVPTRCSSECPSHDAIVPLSVLLSSAATTSSMTTGDVVPKLAAPEVRDRAVPKLAAPEVRDRAIDDDSMGDTSRTATICLLGGPKHKISRNQSVPRPLTPWSVHTAFSMPLLRELFAWSPTACSAKCSGHSTETPSRLQPESYKVFNVVHIVTAILPWPPPNYTNTRPTLTHGYDLLRHAQQKRGKKFLVVRVLQSPLLPPLAVVKESQEELNAKWLDVREHKHPLERIRAVKLKPPWRPFLFLCMNLAIADSSEDDNQLKCEGREHCLIGEILVEVMFLWQIPWEDGNHF